MLIVDFVPEPGDIARAAGLEPSPANETELRSAKLPTRRGRRLAQEHPSGVRILSVSPATLGGRLFSQLYLFLNTVRDSHDLALVCLGGRAATSSAPRSPRRT